MNHAVAETDPVTGWRTYQRLLVYVGQYWPAFVVSILGFCLHGASQAGFAALMQFLPGAFDGKQLSAQDIKFLPGLLQSVGPITYQYFLPLAVIFIVAIRGLGSYLGGFYIMLVARNVINNLRQDLFNHMLVLPGRFYSETASGHLLSLLTFNVEQVTGAATDALKVILREGLTVIVLLFYIFYLNWKLSLVFFLVAPFIGVIVHYTTRLFRRYSKRIQDSVGGVTHVASESIRGFQTVRAFGGLDYERKRFRDASENNLRQSLKMAKANEISTPIIQLLMFSAIALLFYFGLSPELKGEMDTGQFLAYITAASLIAKPLRQLTSVNSKIQKGIAASQSIFAVIDAEAEIDEGDLPLPRTTGHIELRNLNFAYEMDDPILKDINLVIAPGETVALVGRSGSGKSTLANLLPRFNQAPERSIFLDGEPIENYRLSDLRKNIAIVNQNVVLFQDTVARNIAYGDLAGASDEEIRKAATAAHAVEFIDTLKEGMNTQIGEDGVRLSGGQRQRLALARAILKDAPVLILDEATSALDTESERYIQAALAALIKGRTTLIIAHRLSTIEGADRIVVMDEGRIIEIGSHKELLNLEGAYAQLHRMQFSD